MTPTHTRELAIATFYSNQLNLPTPKLEFSATEVKKLLGIGTNTLIKIKQSGELTYSTRGNRHVYAALDIYAYQHRQRDLRTFQQDQIKRAA